MHPLAPKPFTDEKWYETNKTVLWCDNKMVKVWLGLGKNNGLGFGYFMYNCKEKTDTQCWLEIGKEQQSPTLKSDSSVGDSS